MEYFPPICIENYDLRFIQVNILQWGHPFSFSFLAIENRYLNNYLLIGPEVGWACANTSCFT